MPKKKSYLTFTDQFCGAGGSSQGVRRVAEKYRGGIEIKLALNHWKLAIETHNTNFPDTLHDCTDISACDPRRYPTTDILITSPECTTHSPAGGNNHKTLKKQMDLFDSGKVDPSTERSRATMWDVCRFAEYHQYNAIIVENVVEAKTRWPLFDVWLMAMHKLGYDHKCVYLNSMHCHPTPQSRDRMYVVFWRKGNKAPNLDMMPRAYCQKCAKDVDSVQTWKNPNKKYGKYKQQYVYSCPSCTLVVEPYYYASMNVIDWSDIGTRIGDRKRPLSPKTITRIEYGLDKYGGSTFQFHTAFSGQARGIVRHISSPGYSQTTVPSTAIAGFPFIINDQHSTGVDFRVRSSTDKLPTIPCTHQLKLVSPPFIIKLEHTGEASSITEETKTQTCRHSQMLVSNIRSTIEAMQTQTTTQGQGVIVQPGSFLAETGIGGNARRIIDPFSTVTANGIKNGIVTAGTWNSFVASYHNGSHIAKHITESLPTQPTNDANALVTYQRPAVEDCYYRMLKPAEIKLSMAFDHDYVILGNSRDQVKQSGNAVTPPAMEWLSGQVVESLN